MIIEVALGIVLAVFILNFLVLFFEKPFEIILGGLGVYSVIIGNYSMLGGVVLGMILLVFIKEEGNK